MQYSHREQTNVATEMSVAAYAKSMAIKQSTVWNMPAQVQVSHYVRWVWVRWLRVCCSLVHYQWLKRDRRRAHHSRPSDPSLPRSPSLTLSISASLPPHSISFPLCIARSRWGQRQPCGFWGFEPRGLPGKLPRACWAFNEVHNDLCCLMYRKWNQGSAYWLVTD